MNRIAEYLEAAIKEGKAKNDAEIARIVGVSRATISRWRDGECAPSAEQARHLAALLEAPAGMVMAEAEAERTKDAATRAEWLRVARLCSGQAITRTGLGLLLAVTLQMTAAPQPAYASSTYGNDLTVTQILRFRAGRLLAAVQNLARSIGRWRVLRPA